MCALHRHELDADPARQFQAWYDEAASAGGGGDVNAMALATATAEGVPSVRMVLLRRRGRRRPVLLHRVREPQGLRARPKPHMPPCSFTGSALGRQVRIEGAGRAAAGRPLRLLLREPPARQPAGSLGLPPGCGAAIPRGARASTPSRRGAFRRRRVPRPERWGGYRLTPERYEFWQHGDARLHDRFRYRLEHGAWVIERLAP